MQKWIAVILIGAFVVGLALVERSNLSRELVDVSAELVDSQNLIGVQDATLSVQEDTIAQLEKRVLQQADELNASADSAEDYKVLIEQYEALADKLSAIQIENKASADAAFFVRFLDIFTYPLIFDGGTTLSSEVLATWLEETRARAYASDDVWLISAINLLTEGWPAEGQQRYTAILSYCILKLVSLTDDNYYSWLPGDE